MSYEDGGYNGFGGSQVQGGGNFASPSQGTMNQYGAPGGSGGAAKKRDPQSLTSLSIKQCNEAQEGQGKVQVDGRPVQTVKVVANILSVETKETNISMSIEDGSGTMKAMMYLDDGAAPQAIKEGEYRVLIGSLKKLSGQLCLVAYSIAPVDDHNLLTMHMLDVILTHKRVTIGAAPNKAKSDFGAGAKVEHNRMQVDHAMGGVPAANDIRGQVLQMFQTGEGCETDSGCSIAAVASMLSHFTFQQVQEAVIALSNDGHLYSTVDEDHYKTTSA